MKRFLLLIPLCWCAWGQTQQYPPSTGSSSGAVSCTGSPGDTILLYRQQCQVTGTGAVYACNNIAGCTVAADVVVVGGGCPLSGCTFTGTVQGSGYSITAAGAASFASVASTGGLASGASPPAVTCTSGCDVFSGGAAPTGFPAAGLSGCYGSTDGTGLLCSENNSTPEAPGNIGTVGSYQATFTGANIATGKTVHVVVQHGGTLGDITITSDAAVTATLDIQRVTRASWTGTLSGVSIVGSGTKPNIAPSATNCNASGTECYVSSIGTGGAGYLGWTAISFSPGDVVEGVLSGVTPGSATQLTFSMKYTRP